MIRHPQPHGFALIVTLWVVTALATVALCFGHTVRLEQLRAANTVATVDAEQATVAAVRYVQALLDAADPALAMPDADTASLEAVPVGTARFWMIGRSSTDTMPDEPVFGLLDEGAKLNLNTATAEMLAALPGMTAELAAAIVDWRDTDDEPQPDGAESETYLRRDPAYACKNGPFESVEELRLVHGADTDLLYGRDRNRNGALDPWEADGTVDVLREGSLPGLERGLLDYVTVWTRAANLRADGSAKLNINDRGAASDVQQLLQTRFDAEVAARTAASANLGRTRYRSLLEFFLSSQLTAAQFAAIDDDLTITGNETAEGLVNVNTAPAEVLACLPGIGADAAAGIAAYRLSNPDALTSVAWLAQVLDRAQLIEAGPYLTTQTTQVAADVVAIGRSGRGYRRSIVVFDLSGPTRRVVYRRDRTALGWALGEERREELLQ